MGSFNKLREREEQRARQTSNTLGIPVIGANLGVPKVRINEAEREQRLKDEKKQRAVRFAKRFASNVGKDAMIVGKWLVTPTPEQKAQMDAEARQRRLIAEARG